MSISAILTAIMAAVAVAAGITTSAVSGAKANTAKREQLKKSNILEKQRAEENAEFKKDYYRPMTEAADVQDTLRILQENERLSQERADAKGATLGATDELQIANREVNRKTYADSLANLASNYYNMKRADKKDHMGRESEYYKGRLGMQDQIAAINMNESKQLATTADNFMKTGMNMASQVDYDALKPQKDPNQ